MSLGLSAQLLGELGGGLLGQGATGPLVDGGVGEALVHGWRSMRAQTTRLCGVSPGSVPQLPLPVMASMMASPRRCSAASSSSWWSSAVQSPP